MESLSFSQHKKQQFYQIKYMEEKVKNDLDGKPPIMIFTLMILTNILINLDHGILPACTSEMEAQYEMDQAQLGILGSIVYLGISLMGIFAGRLYQHFNSKLLTVIALVVLQFSLLLFVLSTHKVTAYLSRFLTGVCQVFLLVYYPIWIDKFGRDKKTLWITLLQICVPVGIFTGYGMTAVILSTGNHFSVSFYIQIGLVAIFIMAFLFLSNSKLDSRRRLSQDMIQALIDNTQASLITISNEQQIARKTIQQQNHKDKYKFTFMFRKLMKSKMYLVGTFTMSIILYVSTGIQFWLTKYFIDVLHFEETNVFIAYGVVSITGPTTGCAFGGYVINKIGGYDHPTSIYYVLIFSVIGIGSAVIIPFVQNFWALCVLLWIVLYFGGAMMPGLTGLMMSSVSPYLRAFGNSTGEIIKNVFGYLPSPFVYGLFNTLLGNRAGIKFLMFWGLLAPLLLVYGSIHKYKQLKKLKKDLQDTTAVQGQKQQIIYSDEQDQDQMNPSQHPENPEKKIENPVPQKLNDQKLAQTNQTTQI